ncbi:hypothetical protein Bequi_01415 [Brachybacterium sp. JHP9]|uniref:SAV-6107-like HEPN domain-containing protein n=1 Tax=Brachybacterium equifaecis TaxID=2910770 RepID=A0ABT0QXY3_9MICO|nr:hypothetical protein [Brachybacterium equifaecis]MCL6422058.1 hypothetical protein [Brachybacterium equifaecis]
MNSSRLELIRLDQDLAALERAQQLLHQARSVRRDDPRAAFELIHRSALRTAGVLVARANRTRRRSLPLNVWKALDRMGASTRPWALEASAFVAERDRLDRDQHAVPDPQLLQAHLEGTAHRIASVRAQLLSELTSSSAVALAG